MHRNLRRNKIIIFAISLCLFLLVRFTLNWKSASVNNVRRLGRELLSLPLHEDDCVTSKGAVEEFPKDFFTQEQRLNGAIICHISVAMYTFALLAVVCDDYFVVSLYHICARLKMDNDVAGATFMAIGSSAPTLFISVISIFFTESGGDVGLGTVVGSTIFNTLFIIAICGLFAKQVISLSCYPLLRDSFMYTLGTIALVITIRDRQVKWFEALSFVLVYTLYIIVMYFNKKLERFFIGLKEKYCGVCSDDQNDSRAESTDEEEKYDKTLLSEETFNKMNAEKRAGDKSPLEVVKSKSMADLAGLNLGKNIATQTTFQERNTTPDNSETVSKIADLSQFEHKQDSPFHVPKGVFAKVAWILGMPVCLLFYITIPPCCKRRWSEWYLVTFLMSVLWMGTLSYVLVWMVCILGYTFNIPDCVMGMTFLAAGSSIPDVMASVIVARQGEGDMALSNAIGSNVFDMLCLGVPWLMKSTILNPGSSVMIYSQSIMVSALLLIGSIVFTVLAIHLNNWKLDPKLGVIFLIVYLVFISLATLVEFIACPCQLEV